MRITPVPFLIVPEWETPERWNGPTGRNARFLALWPAATHLLGQGE
jgi:hypothetical protein